MNNAEEGKDPLDELNFPNEVAELIISYLPLRDRLNACLVSKLWNATIGNSLSFKRSTTLSIHTWDSNEKIRDEFFQQIYKSDRSYDDIEIRTQKLDAWFYVAFDNVNKNNFKNVTINGIENVFTLKDALKAFKFVKHLRLIDTTTRSRKSDNMIHHVKPLEISLENMESLVISSMDANIFQLFVRCHPKLKTVSLRFLTSTSKQLSQGKASISPPIREFLLENPSIENLEMDYRVVQEIFKNNLSEIVENLKLKCLVLGMDGVEDVGKHEVNIGVRGWRRPQPESESDYDEFEDYSDDELDVDFVVPSISQEESSDPGKIREHLQKFLESQGNNLINLKMILNQEQRRFSRWSYAWEHNEERRISSKNLNILFNSWPFMTALKNLTIRFLIRNMEERAEDILTLKSLTKNVNISFLGFQFVNVTPPLQTIMGFLSVCRNVIEIYVTILNEQILNFCTLHLRNLKLIKCYKFDGDCLKIYEELKESRRNSNCSIKIEDGHVLG